MNPVCDCGNEYNPALIQVERNLFLSTGWLSQWKCDKCGEWVDTQSSNQKANKNERTNCNDCYGWSLEVCGPNCTTAHIRYVSKRVLVEIEFEDDVDISLVKGIISNRDAVQLLGKNIIDVKVRSSEQTARDTDE